ncbi:hypothetical protein N431DRAFT_432493 [Stipitochalara longipes BDJ]|nr:hypothetical protein N431DRAFT_432493 [Stipitochalara longipes BDJ]
MDHGNSISTEEEARRRRTAQPRKSSIKKAKATNESIHTSELRPVATAVKDTAHAESKAAFQFQSGGRSSYNRAVSGSKPQTPKTSNPSTAGESTQRPWISANYSPNMPPLKRNKRVGSSTAQTQGVPKRIRTSRGSSLADCLEVADSQDQSTF